MCDNINSHAGTRGEKGAKGDDGGCGRHREEGQGGRQHSQRLFRQGVQQVQNKLSLVADGGKSPKLIVCKSPAANIENPKGTLCFIIRQSYLRKE